MFLKVSKCNQFGRGVAVFVGATSDELCPVSAILEYVTMRGDREGPFFLLHDGTPLTKSRFITGVHQALIQASIPYQTYSGHSLIGAATVVSQAGLPDSTIQALGRWSSTAFLRYIRTPRSQLAQLLTRSLPQLPLPSHRPVSLQLCHGYIAMVHVRVSFRRWQRVVPAIPIPH